MFLKSTIWAIRTGVIRIESFTDFVNIVLFLPCQTNFASFMSCKLEFSIFLFYCFLKKLILKG